MFYCKSRKDMVHCIQNLQTKRCDSVKISQMRSIAKLSPQEPLSEKRSQLNTSLEEDGYVPGSIYQELEMDSPYVDTHDDISESEDVVQLHSHTFYEILFCRGGSLQYLLGTERYHLQHGDVVFVPPGVSHRPLFLEKLVEPYTRDVVWLSPLFAKNMNDLFPDEEILPDRPFVLRSAGTRWEEILSRLFRSGVKEGYARLPGWQAAVYGNTMRLMVQLYRAHANDKTPTPPTEKQELLDRLLFYVESEMGQKITLAETARRFLISESTINQLFRKRMKVSFYHYVTQRRLIAAKSLLLDGRAADQVCTMVGFGDYSTFYRAFKQEYGISPAEYRRLQEGQPHEP